MLLHFPIQMPTTGITITRGDTMIGTVTVVGTVTTTVVVVAAVAVPTMTEDINITAETEAGVVTVTAMIEGGSMRTGTAVVEMADTDMDTAVERKEVTMVVVEMEMVAVAAEGEIAMVTLIEIAMAAAGMMIDVPIAMVTVVVVMWVTTIKGAMEEDTVEMMTGAAVAVA